MFTATSKISTALENDAARAVLARYLPGVVNSPMLVQIMSMPIGVVADHDHGVRADPALRERLFAELAAIDDRGAGDPRPEEPPIPPDPAYEGADVPRASATARFPDRCAQWDVFEIEIAGPAHGNPFVDVELTATFGDGERELRAGGFYDGDGTYRIRFMPDRAASWTFTTSSTARSLDGLTGTFVSGPQDPGRHGPVRVADGHHFRHADGTRYLPIGTTAYAWTHQPERLRTATRRALADSAFNKVRMCVLPKAYLYNTDDPELYPFVSSPSGDWDTTRFDPSSSGASRTRSWPCANSASRPTSSSSTPTTAGASPNSAGPPTTGSPATWCGASPRSPTCGGRWPTSTTWSGPRPRTTGSGSPPS